MENLSQQIKELNENLALQLPPEVLQVFSQSIQDLKTENIEVNCIKTGDLFPDFGLPNSNNETIQLKELLKKGKVIVAFFRGNWCPYCNLELKALQDKLKDITDNKVTLVGISPQTIDSNEELKGNLELGFELLTDKDNNLAKQLGISFKLQDYVIPVYEILGIELAEYNENNDNELPIPAVFVIDVIGNITYKFIDSNYMNRINIQELVKQL